ncbi:MAG: hypothetical protein AAF383_23475, partial [Cyanobacteria bacterium P01_A01_bin.83]
MSTINYIQENNTEVATSNSSNNSSDLGFNIELELNVLAELIINSTTVPLTEYTIVDRVVLLHQLHQIQEHLPVDLATAMEIANCRQQIIAEAENYASLLVKSAEAKAKQMIQDSAILRQAELDGAKIRLKIEREYEQLKQNAESEIEQLRQNAIAECLSIQMGA